MGYDFFFELIQVHLRGEIMKYDNVNKLFISYMVVTSLCCLLMPGSLDLAATLRWRSEDIPVYSWIAGVPGVLPFYKDFFVLTWMALPAWLIAYGVIYVREYSSMGINIPLLVMVMVFLAFILAFFLFWDLRIEGEGATSRVRLMVLAAKFRPLGAFIFPGIMMIMFMLFAAIFVKFPIDLVRNAFR